MKSRYALVLAVLASVASWPALAQNGSSPRTLLIYVAPMVNEHYSLSPSEHVLKFEIPVQIPGVALPAGPFIFRLLASSVVQVMSANRSKVYATLLTIPATGNGDTNRERVEFELNPEDDLPRIRGWYLPGSTGHEFLYPKPKRPRADQPKEER